MNLQVLLFFNPVVLFWTYKNKIDKKTLVVYICQYSEGKWGTVENQVSFKTWKTFKSTNLRFVHGEFRGNIPLTLESNHVCE